LARSQKLFTRDGLRGDALSRFFGWLMDTVESHGETAAARIAYGKQDFAGIVKEFPKQSKK
jgi:hypothetical protein